MTTTNSLKVEYDRNAKADKPIIRLALMPSLFAFLKAWLLGEYAWHYLTDDEVDMLARYIARYTIIKRLREQNKHAT